MINLFKKTVWYILMYSEIACSEITEPVICNDNTKIRLDGLSNSTLGSTLSNDYIPCAQILSYLVNRNTCGYKCKKLRQVKKSSYQGTGKCKPSTTIKPRFRNQGVTLKMKKNQFNLNERIEFTYTVPSHLASGSFIAIIPPDIPHEMDWTYRVTHGHTYLNKYIWTTIGQVQGTESLRNPGMHIDCKGKHSCVWTLRMHEPFRENYDNEIISVYFIVNDDSYSTQSSSSSHCYFGEEMKSVYTYENETYNDICFCSMRSLSRCSIIG